MEKREVLALLQQNSSVIQILGVKRLGLFGSYARGEQTAASDVDLLVEFDAGKKSFESFMTLAYFLEDLLGKPVELITRESMSPYIQPYVSREVEYVSFVG